MNFKWLSLFVYGSFLLTGICLSQARKGSPSDVRPEETEAMMGLKDLIKGKIVWSSSREGNHNIYIMNCDGSDKRALTRSAKTDWFSRFSPDGKKVIFCRSKMDWTPETNANTFKMWDTWIIEVTGENERLFIPNSTWATWQPDGKTILFARGTQVLTYDIASGQENLVCDSKTDMNKEAILQNPHLSPDGNYLAITLRGKKRETGIFDLVNKTWQKINVGCQINWFHKGDKIYRVHPTGNGGSEVVVQAVNEGKPVDSKASLKSTSFMDLPGRRSHEYFPQISVDGQWMVWAATQRGHDHDVADYEIYIWKIGSPQEDAVRLTFHSGNDRWPDIFLE